MQQNNHQRKATFLTHLTSRLILGLAAIAILIGQNVSTVSAQSTANLQNAVYRMNAWLAGSDNAEGWRKYLHLNLLDAQAALGDQAVLATLQKIHRRFDSDVDGVDAVEFQDVRTGIEQKIKLLSEATGADLNWLADQAALNYRPISIGDLENARDEAVYELSLLKKYYRKTMSSRKRAGLFYDLQLNEQIDYLTSLEFELPPEISVGKTTSQIKDEQQRLKEVEKEIDAMPVGDRANSNDGPGPEENDPLVLPPGPDNGDASLEELKEQQQRIEKRIDELKEMRLDLAEKDRDRVASRRDVLRQLARFNSRYEDVAEKRFDPYFLSTALVAERFNFLYFYGTDDNLQEEFLNRIDTLKETLAESADMSDRKSHAELGKLVQWFESANQVPQMVSAIRAKFSNPNAYFSVSSNMINQLAGQDVSERQRIKQQLFGRIIRGVANVNGTVSVQLNPDPNQANVTISLLGSITSQTYTRERKFRIDVNSSGSYSGQRNVFANVGGFYADVAEVNACVYSSYGGITSNIGLIQKLAAKSFAKGKSKADAESSRRTSDQILEMFQAQTDEALAEGHQQFDKLQEKMIDKQSLVPAAYWRTYGDRIEIVAIKQNQGSLAASSPAMVYGANRDVQAKVHETMLSNYTDPIFAGKTFTNKELEAEATRRFNIEPPALDPKEDSPLDADAIPEEQFSITFARVRPIQFEFDGNRLAVTVTGVRFAQEGRAIRAGLRFRVQFKLEDINGQLELRRDGPAQIDYLDPDKKDAKIVAFRSLLEKKLNEGLKDDEGIPIPRNLIPVDQLENADVAGNLLLSQLRFEDGWAYVGWEYAPGGYQSLPVDVPAIVYSPAESGYEILSETMEVMEVDSVEGNILEGQIYVEPPAPVMNEGEVIITQ